MPSAIPFQKSNTQSYFDATTKSPGIHGSLSKVYLDPRKPIGKVTHSRILGRDCHGAQFVNEAPSVIRSRLFLRMSIKSRSVRSGMEFTDSSIMNSLTLRQWVP